MKTFKKKVSKTKHSKISEILLVPPLSLYLMKWELMVYANDTRQLMAATSE